MKDEQTQTSEVLIPQHEEVKPSHFSQIDPPNQCPQWAERRHFPEMEQEHVLVMAEKNYSPATVEQANSQVRVPQHRFPVRVQQKHCRGKEDFDTLLAKKQEQYARLKAEKQQYLNAIAKLRKMVDDYENFLALHPKQVAKVQQRNR